MTFAGVFSSEEHAAPVILYKASQTRFGRLSNMMARECCVRSVQLAPARSSVQHDFASTAIRLSSL